MNRISGSQHTLYVHVMQNRPFRAQHDLIDSILQLREIILPGVVLNECHGILVHADHLPAEAGVGLDDVEIDDLPDILITLAEIRDIEGKL